MNRAFFIVCVFIGVSSLAVSAQEAGTLQDDLITVCERYWDNYDFHDITPLDSPEAILDYIYLLENVPDSIARNSVRLTFEQAERNMSVFLRFVLLFERYLYNPKSIFYNEDMWLFVLDCAISSDKIDETAKMHLQLQRELVCAGKPGSAADDFAIRTKNGKEFNLYDMECDYIVLLFNNPGCHYCEAIETEIISDSVIRRLQESGRLEIIAVYPSDDIALWMKTAYPASWISGYDIDGRIYPEILYRLKSVPEIYLLDKNKKVLFREESLKRISEYLTIIK